MRKIICTLVLCVLTLLLGGCTKAEEMGSLSDFSRPYAGEYICKKLQLGEEDYIEKFDYIKLKLSQSGAFQLSYQTEEGLKEQFSGKYAVSEEGDEITFSAKSGFRTASRSFPFENGTVHINLTFRGKLLHAEFQAP